MEPRIPAETASAGPLVLTGEFERTLRLLHQGENLFLTGKAGTGKSTLVRTFLADTERRVLVAAPTGIAALNVGGYTIHRVFGFTPTTTLEDVRSGAYRPGRFARALASVQTLVVDEASMVRADMFDMVAAALERYGPRPGLPFGGVQVVFVGDLFQLPPVVTEAEADFFRTVYETPYFFSAGAYRAAPFSTATLTRVFRQAGDPRLTTILNAIREGSLAAAASAELGTRTDRDFTPPEGEFWLRLTTTNRIAAARNRRRLDALVGEEFVHHAERLGELDRFEAPTEDVLRFKAGAQIMMLTNDPAADRWVNGTIGRIADARWTDDGAVVTAEFTDGTIAEVTTHTWEVTRPVAAGSGLRHEVIGTFTQLPFKLAWAITIHKSQGQTVDRLIVDLSGGTFAYGQLYVALSRCTSLAGLVLTRPVLPKDLKTDRRILRFLRGAEAGRASHRYCAIALLTVGNEAARSRPRPVELAVAFDDGTAVTTLVNPQRDMADAARAYGVTTADVLLAPTLTEAWAVLAPLLDGYTPVGVGVDVTLGLVDFELKRLGASVPMPLGVDLPPRELTPDERFALGSGTALTRAESALAARERLEATDAAAGRFDAAQAPDSDVGLLLTRDRDAPTPSSAHLPQLSAVLAVGRATGAALLGLPRTDATDGDVTAPAAAPPTGEPEAGDPARAEARLLIAAQIRRAAARTPVDDDTLARLRAAGEVLGTDLAAGVRRADAHGAADVLTTGARVCFTGEAVRPGGIPVLREEMMTLARRSGLVAVDTVTKTKCDALVTAEVSTQSGKARKARDYGKPIIAAADFLAWADRP